MNRHERRRIARLTRTKMVEGVQDYPYYFDKEEKRQAILSIQYSEVKTKSRSGVEYTHYIPRLARMETHANN